MPVTKIASRTITRIPRTTAIGITISLAMMLTALVPAAHAATRNVTLEWTAPGDDGYIGKATGYEIRFSRYPINEQNFSFATRLNTAILPGPGGAHERLTVFGLQLGVPYYFALRAWDDAANQSRISNVAYLSPGVADSQGPVALDPDFSAPRPNPAGTSTSFAVTLPKQDQLRVEAFDIGGRKIRTIALGQYSGGTFNLQWDLRDDSGNMLNAGTYLVRGQLGENIFLRRVNVVR